MNEFALILGYIFIGIIALGALSHIGDYFHTMFRDKRHIENECSHWRLQYIEAINELDELKIKIADGIVYGTYEK